LSDEVIGAIKARHSRFRGLEIERFAACADARFMRAGVVERAVLHVRFALMDRHAHLLEREFIPAGEEVFEGLAHAPAAPSKVCQRDRQQTVQAGRQAR
jgi:hypothetical protein